MKSDDAAAAGGDALTTGGRSTGDDAVGRSDATGRDHAPTPGGTRARSHAVDGDDAPQGEDDLGDEAATRAYLAQVSREIDDEVRRRRAAGDFPPSFERRLDELFARFTPTGTADDHFTEALKLADRSAYFDIDVPRGTRRRPKGFVKWSLWQAEAWFVRYVVTQLNHFAASAMRVLHLLDERMSEAEGELALLTPPPLADDGVVAPGADPAPFVEALLERVRAPDVPAGRVVHAECGDGGLVRALAGAGLDAYGIDPGTPGADRAVEEGLDVRRDDVLGHLASVGDERLAGVVLSGCVDRMSIAERRRLLQLAELKLGPGGTLAIVGIAPESWESTVGAVVADLAPGRPLHAQTWAHLIGELGFVGVQTRLAPAAGREVSGEPASFAVFATKRARSEGSGASNPGHGAR